MTKNIVGLKYDLTEEKTPYGTYRKFSNLKLFLYDNPSVTFPIQVNYQENMEKIVDAWDLMCKDNNDKSEVLVKIREIQQITERIQKRAEDA
jgi:hypothetical protein